MLRHLLERGLQFAASEEQLNHFHWLRSLELGRDSVLNTRNISLIPF